MVPSEHPSRLIQDRLPEVSSSGPDASPDLAWDSQFDLAPPNGETSPRPAPTGRPQRAAALQGEELRRQVSADMHQLDDSWRLPASSTLESRGHDSPDGGDM